MKSLTLVRRIAARPAIVFADAFFKLMDGPTMTCDAVIVVLSTLPITSTVVPLVTAFAVDLLLPLS